MAPQRFAGSAGLRVLLAGNTADDLQAARDFLQGEGALGAYSLVASQDRLLHLADEAIPRFCSDPLVE